MYVFLLVPDVTCVEPGQAQNAMYMWIHTTTLFDENAKGEYTELYSPLKMHTPEYTPANHACMYQEMLISNTQPDFQIL